MDQAIVAEPHAKRWAAKSTAGRATRPQMSPLRTAEAATLAFDADAVLFELGVASPRWSYDGLRPQLRFSFDVGQAIAAIQDAPARNISCAPGSFALLSSGMRVRVSHITPVEILALTFGPEPLADVAAIAGERPIQITDQGVGALAAEVRRALIEEPHPGRGYMAALGKAMLVRALRVIDGGAPSPVRMALSPFRLRRVVDHIEARLDCRITVPELAELAQLSPAHFARAFRQATGEAPHHFILSRRIARVRELLRDPALRLTTVAFRAGFSSHAHMSNVFRRRTGVAPAAYRAGVCVRRAG
jgi:AraC family transcriptional regulator